MKTHRIGLLLGLVFGVLVTFLTSQAVYAGKTISCWSKTCAYNYAYSVLYEPYRVTHEEWIDDDKNQNLPGKTGTHISEGVDCSGLMYKVWAMTGTEGDSKTFTCYKTDETVSTRYKASEFWYGCKKYNGTKQGCTLVCGKGLGTACTSSNVKHLDAYVVISGTGGFTQDHVALILNPKSDGTFTTIDAMNSSKIYGFSSGSLYNYTKPDFRVIRRAYSSSCTTCTSACPTK